MCRSNSSLTCRLRRQYLRMPTTTHSFIFLTRLLYQEADSEKFITGTHTHAHAHTHTHTHTHTLSSSLPPHRDTYWILEGLLLCGMNDTARGMIENLVYLVDQ